MKFNPQNIGTPENPDRSNSLHARYWEGYFGWRKPSDFPAGSAARECVRKGQEDAKVATP